MYQVLSALDHLSEPGRLKVRIRLINPLRKGMDAACSAPSPMFEVAFMPFIHIASGYILQRNAGCSTQQENITDSRASAFRVSGDLIGASNVAASFSSIYPAASSFFKGFLSKLKFVKRNFCERRANTISVDFQLPTNCANKTLKKIAKQFGVSVSGLEVRLKQLMKEFSAEMAKTISSPHPQYFPLIDAIYKLYVLSKGNENLSLPWMETLKDFDLFIGHFCPEANNRSRAGIMRHIKIFCHTSKLLVEKESSSSEWSYFVPGEGLRDVPKQFASIPLLLEVLRLREKNTYPFGIDNRIHSTGSAALENIGKAGAILSARELLKSKYEIKTGEYVECIEKNGFACSGGKKGLAQIFTSTNNFSSMDAGTQRWFDEFSVGFCIDVEKQNNYNMQNGLELYINQSNLSGEGIVVGPKVPLENVTAISAPKANEKQVQEWIDQYCPWALFISKEAARVIEGRR